MREKTIDAATNHCHFHSFLRAKQTQPSTTKLMKNLIRIEEQINSINTEENAVLELLFELLQILKTII